MSAGEFLVYEHWRPDKGVCFYVGKGKPKRSKQFQRNQHYDRVVAKLRRAGLEVEVRIIASGRTEQQAFDIEIERIKFWRDGGVEITNKTAGGDGSSGYRFTPEQKEKIRTKATGRIFSAEARRKMSESRRGQKRSSETREKMSAAAKRAQPAARKAACATEQGRRRMVEMARAAASDPTMRAKRSANAKQLWADPGYRRRVMEARRRPVVEGLS